MTDIITREVSSSDLKELVNKLIPDSMSVDITKACQGIYPLHDVHIRKVHDQILYGVKFQRYMGNFHTIMYFLIVRVEKSNTALLGDSESRRYLFLPFEF